MANWIILSLFAGLFLGVINFITRIIKTGPMQYLSIQFLTVGILLLPFAIRDGLTGLTILSFMGVGVLVLIANLLIFAAIQSAPNPGYAYTILSGLGGAILFILASTLLKESVTITKIIGAIMVLIGATLIII